jgi:hypothetical protein
MVEINLAPAEVDIFGVRAGDRNLIQVTVRQGGHPVNLAGYTVTAQARTTSDQVDHLDAVCRVTSETAGQVDVRWPGDAVRTWIGEATAQKGVWDLQLDDGSGDPWTVMAGSFAAEWDVTR